MDTNFRTVLTLWMNRLELDFSKFFPSGVANFLALKNVGGKPQEAANLLICFRVTNKVKKIQPSTLQVLLNLGGCTYLNEADLTYNYLSYSDLSTMENGSEQMKSNLIAIAISYLKPKMLN